MLINFCRIYSYPDGVKPMFYRLLPALLLPLVMLITGCGGGGSTPVVIPGDFFPLNVGQTWDFDVDFSINGMGQVLDDIPGTMTRTLVGRESIILDGTSRSAYVFEHVYTIDNRPDLSVFGNTPLREALELLFSQEGGLQTVRSYYTISEDALGSSDRIRLSAISEGDGPVEAIPTPRPYFLNPPYDGHMQSASRCFPQMPLMPPMATVQNSTATEKLLDYGDTGGPLGTRRSVVAICYFQSQFHFGDTTGSINGRARTFYQDGVGMSANLAEPSDWSATVTVPGGSAIVTSTLRFADQ